MVLRTVKIRDWHISDKFICFPIIFYIVKLFFPPLFLLIFCRWHVSYLSFVFISSVSSCRFLRSYNYPLPLAFLLRSRFIYVGLLRVRNRYGNFVREWLASLWHDKCCPNNRSQEMQEWRRSWYVTFVDSSSLNKSDT